MNFRRIASRVAYMTSPLSDRPDYGTSGGSVPRGDSVAVVVHEHGKFCVKSPSNPDWSGGCYDTKKEAEDRLKQVEMMKHINQGH
jgi:hypothetical protein